PSQPGPHQFLVVDQECGDHVAGHPPNNFSGQYASASSSGTIAAGPQGDEWVVRAIVPLDDAEAYCPLKLLGG
ncbi:hypothetical protein C6A85_14250, partial [Mycobacterium sp. ITM-2017-0098]